MRNKIALIVLFLIASMIIGGCGVKSISREKFQVVKLNGKDKVVCVSKDKAWFGYLMSINEVGAMYGRSDDKSLEVGAYQLLYATDPNSIDAVTPVIIPRVK